MNRLKAASIPGDFLPVPTGLLQRACACGNRAAGGNCGACQKKNEGNGLQRSAARNTSPAEAPAIVHEVLRSPGEPIDAATRTVMESSFGYDFSKVRIHRDAKAAASARSVDALAYTVGNEVVFESGRYAPRTREGRSLLAHELTHVVQQGGYRQRLDGKLSVGAADDESERAAETAARAIDADRPVSAAAGGGGGILQRSPAGADADPLHQPMIDDYRRSKGLPADGRDESGRPFGPSDAEIKYQLNRPSEDPDKIRIDPVPDFTASSLTAGRDVPVHVNDARVVALDWQLRQPDGRTIASTSTTAGQANATSQPFTLQPAQFSGKGFVEGGYMLYCYGLDKTGSSVIFARRDFNVLNTDLKTKTALATTYGNLTFTRYESKDATATNPNWSASVDLEFLPNAKVSCDDIAFIQTGQALDPTGKSLWNLVNPAIVARQTSLAWAIDQVAGNRSPFYIAETNPATGVTQDHAGFGQAGKSSGTPKQATLSDTSQTNLPATAAASLAVTSKYESCAVCRSGQNIGQVYGCATWGYAATAAGKVTLMPRSFRPMPSEQFMEASAEWNKWRASQPAATRPFEIPGLKQP